MTKSVNIFEEPVDKEKVWYIWLNLNCNVCHNYDDFEALLKFCIIV